MFLMFVIKVKKCFLMFLYLLLNVFNIYNYYFTCSFVTQCLFFSFTMFLTDRSRVDDVVRGLLLTAVTELSCGKTTRYFVCIVDRWCVYAGKLGPIRNDIRVEH